MPEQKNPSLALTREELARIIDERAFMTAPLMRAASLDPATFPVDQRRAAALVKADAILARLSPLPAPEKQQNQEHTLSVAESGGSPTTSVKSDSPHSAGGRD